MLDTVYWRATEKHSAGRCLPTPAIWHTVVWKHPIGQQMKRISVLHIFAFHQNNSIGGNQTALLFIAESQHILFKVYCRGELRNIVYVRN